MFRAVIFEDPSHIFPSGNRNYIEEETELRLGIGQAEHFPYPLEILFQLGLAPVVVTFNSVLHEVKQGLPEDSTERPWSPFKDARDDVMESVVGLKAVLNDSLIVVFPW